VKLSFNMLFVLSVTVAAFMFFHAEKVMELLYNYHVDDSSAIVVVLMFCYVCIAASYIFGTLLTANGNLNLLNKIAGAGLLINVLLNLWLIPSYHAIGAAIASLVTQGIIISVQIISTKNIFNFSIDVVYLLRLMVFVSVIFASFYATTLFSIALFPQLLLAGVISLSIGLLIKIIDLKSLWLILKNKVE